MATFNKGDTVRLKSGGPLMTVEEVGVFGIVPKEGVKCVWFDKNLRKEEVFDPAVIKPSDNSLQVSRVVRG